MKKRSLCLSLLLCLLAWPSMAQLPSAPLLSWDDFVQEYLEDDLSETSDPLTDEELEWLEGIALHPLQINRITRSELLALPFMNEAQADSIVAYRTAKYGLRSLGELQLISGIDYYTRRYLSLFVRCDSLPENLTGTGENATIQPSLGHKLSRGRHELETRADLPLYRRDGYRKPDKPTPTNYYTGNVLHHLIRYRYAYQQEVAYGLTLEKDAGEPVMKQGFAPYDYWSGFVMIRPAKRGWGFVAGDYEIRGGRGLLFGRQFFTGREQFAQGTRRSPTTFRPHSSTDEIRFFRGAAVSYNYRDWRSMVFVSYRRLDARFDESGDTVRSLPATGLHRTVSEIRRRRNTGCLTTGMHLGFEKRHISLSADGYVARYDHTVSPEIRFYNRHYFRGQTAGGGALSYSFTQGSWTVQGELAADHHLHLSTEHSVSVTALKRTVINLQVRSFSPRFVSLYGEALQQGSRVANEQGVMAGWRYRPRGSWELTGYIDLFRFPEPTYTSVLGGAKGLEAQLQCKWRMTGNWHLTTRYRMKVRQQTVSGYRQMEYRQKHRLRLAAQKTSRRIDLSTQLDGTLSLRQTGKRAWGGAASARCAWNISDRLKLKTFASIFATDDYESAVYVYEPQLPRAASFNALTYHGTRAVGLCDWQVCRPLSLALRISSTRYFNRSMQSSGPATIRSAWKNDLSLQLRWNPR